MSTSTIYTGMNAYDQRIPEYRDSPGMVGYKALPYYISPEAFTRYELETNIDTEIPWMEVGELLPNTRHVGYDRGNSDRHPRQVHYGLFAKMYPVTPYAPKRAVYRMTDEAGKIYDLYVNRMNNNDLIVVPGLGEMIVKIQYPVPVYDLKYENLF